MSTLKELAATAKLVAQEGLEKALTELKTYIDTKDTEQGAAASAAIQAVSDKLNALIGEDGGDVDKIINTFNEVKAFLADYDEDDTLKSLLDAVNSSIASAQSTLQNAITAESERATAAENALSGRVTTLENVSVMTADEAKTLFDEVFNA